MTDLQAREVRFRWEIMLMRMDRPFVSVSSLNNHVRRVAADYGVPTWWVRRLVES